MWFFTDDKHIAHLSRLRIVITPMSTLWLSWDFIPMQNSQANRLLNPPPYVTKREEKKSCFRSQIAFVASYK